ncbi:amidase signature domain-containing protein [Amylocarpus encephaloides]|uniref:Amidase signature domain-containing protein n=1 Tax=Amylocarpus encephaloides TaxID=45428 RepID=A0A9P7Y8Y2_9HELO|nr:amidase signature domain-containing protein [Amylocarpus encephaloides]
MWRKIMPSLSNFSIRDLLAGLQEQSFTSVDLVQAYLIRIEQVNGTVKAINAITPDVLQTARELDLERASGTLRGGLHGIPVLVKDVFLTTDGTDTTAGCSGLAGAIPMFEATAIEKLRSAGAIIIGKANCSEWVNFRAPEKSISGWSAVGGQGLGIYAKNQSPSGSSSGSAVATSLGLAAAALGTETSGSICSPARVSGVVGLKPTVGLTSRHGVYCVTEWEDSVGVLGRTVLDAATVLTAIAGIDELDTFTSADPRDEGQNNRPAEGTDFTESCGTESLRGVRIGVPRHCIKQDDVVTAQFNEALRNLETLGATVIDNLEFSMWSPKYSDIDRAGWRLAFRKELRENMSKFLESFSTNPFELHNLADLMEYTKKTPEEMFERYGMKQWVQAEDVGKTFSLESEEYIKSRQQRLTIGCQIKELLVTHNCAFLVAPSWTDTTANYGGCPTVSVPMGCYPSNSPSKYTHDGLLDTGPDVPTSILFIGKRWDDKRLIAAAYAYEQGTHHRDAFKPVVEVTAELETSAPDLVHDSEHNVVKALVNYLRPHERWLTIKPYQIVGTLPEGLSRQNVDAKAYAVQVTNSRASIDWFSLDKQGFQWITHQRGEILSTEESIDEYVKEMENFVKSVLNAKVAKTYQYQHRKVGGDPNNKQIRPASNMIHIDMTPKSSRDRALQQFPELGDKILKGRIRIMSVWRPLFGPIDDYPLAVCDSETVAKEDLVESDHIFPDFQSETYCVLHNNRHRWYYLSGQTSDEVLLITNYDSETNKRVPHTGFKMPSSEQTTRVRESLELRMVVLG